MYTPIEFLARMSDRPMTMLDRAVALLWHTATTEPTKGMTARAIATILQAGGYPEQNISRLEANLKADRRAVRARPNGWRIAPQARLQLDTDLEFAIAPRPLAHRDSVIPRDIVAGTRGYLERVVEQINKSFDAQLYDCCAVMCRRLLETLIIEVYESKGRTSDIKAADGNFIMLSGLLDRIEKDPSIHMSRNGLAGLKAFKTLGDLSAHNRRFNARQSDIERIRDGLRVSVEELIHIAAFKPSTVEARRAAI